MQNFLKNSNTVKINNHFKSGLLSIFLFNIMYFAHWLFSLLTLRKDLFTLAHLLFHVLLPAEVFILFNMRALSRVILEKQKNHTESAKRGVW